MPPVHASKSIRLRPAEAEAPVRRDANDGLRLQLSVSRAGLGLESAARTTVGALRIDALTTTLPGLTFPVDLSGGVTRFRHRRGELAKLELSFLREPMSRELERRLGGDARADVTILPRDGGATIGLAYREAALAFDLVWAPVDGRLRLVVERARAVGLPISAHRAALGVLDAAVKGVGSRAGSVAMVDDLAGRVLRLVLPLIGARAPSTERVVLSLVGASAEGFRCVAERDVSPPRLEGGALAALETAELTCAADDALLAGDLDAARREYLRALELAPHHPEIARRLSDLDRCAGDRDEAAMATLALVGPLLDAGALGASLLAATGDGDAARAAYESAAHREPFATLAARCLAEAAALASDPRDRLALLSSAVARAPTSGSLRALRLDAALARGDVAAALAEAEHMEAGARAADDKVTALVDAASAFAKRGAVGLAGPLLERALRYRPTNEEALIMLAKSLREIGRFDRAADVLARTLVIAARRKVARHDAAVLLASILLDDLGELPLAVARARTIPLGATEHAEARAIEGRALAKLGDRASASVAYARMRDAVTAGAPIDAGRAAQWLVEAASFEEDERGDVLAAKAHLSRALELVPRDRAVVAAFRRVASSLDRPAPEEAIEREPDPPTMAAPSQIERVFDAPSADTGELLGQVDEDRIEQLTASVRANPSNIEVVLELAGLLENAGRDLELFALLSARLEEGDDDTRAVLSPIARAALRRLAAGARVRGSEAEAKIYDDLAASLR